MGFPKDGGRRHTYLSFSYIPSPLDQTERTPAIFSLFLEWEKEGFGGSRGGF